MGRAIKSKGKVVVKALKIMKKLAKSKSRKHRLAKKIAKQRTGTAQKVLAKARDVTKKAHRQVRKASKKAVKSKRQIHLPGKRKQIKAVAKIVAKATKAGVKQAVRAKKAKKHAKHMPKAKKYAKQVMKVKKSHPVNIKKVAAKLAPRVVHKKPVDPQIKQLAKANAHKVVNTLKTLPRGGKTLSPTVHDTIKAKKGSKLASAYSKEDHRGTFYAKTGAVRKNTVKESAAELMKAAMKSAGKSTSSAMKKFKKVLAAKLVAAVKKKHAELAHKKKVATRVKKKPAKLRGPTQADFRHAVKAAKYAEKTSVRHGKEDQMMNGRRKSSKAPSSAVKIAAKMKKIVAAKAKAPKKASHKTKEVLAKAKKEVRGIIAKKNKKPAKESFSKRGN